VSDELDAIRRVVDAFERSDWAEIDVRVGDLHIHLASSAATTQGPEPVAPPPERPSPDRPEPSRAEIPDGASVVTSPSPGIFWRAPEPGAPPFTEIGRRVEPSSTVCIIEIMKLMSHVKAGMAGEVVAIYAENGVAVAKEAPLFAIRTEV
jgi:acetyl-CoA carboxylase biotin carboxyl carrier protein